MKKDNLIGQKFGRLLVVKEGERSSSGRVRWHCVCDCGKELDVYGPSLKSGNTKSCGCYHSDAARISHTTHGFGSRKNRPRIYSIWCAMKSRCYQPKHGEYHRYGGRGIAVCDEWRTSFEAFKEWADKSGYNSTLDLDRIDNDKGYSPENCRWVTKKANANNTSQNHRVFFRGSMRTIAEVADMVNLPYWAIYQRVTKLKWKGEDLARPSRIHKRKTT